MSTGQVNEGGRAAGARISLLYHSGAGGTKVVAELLAEVLAADHPTRAVSVHDPASSDAVARGDLLVFCFPTYYLKPSPSMAEFIARLPAFGPPRTAYLVATKELYTENCLRTCALSLKRRGVRTAGSRVLRAPGTDVTCLVPDRLCRWLYRFERGFTRKLLATAREISAIARIECPPERIPPIKWYTPFTQLLQVLALNRLDGWREKVRILPERCSGCDACVRWCDRGAWTREGDGLRHVSERCELCTRCVHRCPRRAIILVEALKDSPRLDRQRYARLKAEARVQLAAAAPRGERR